MNSPEQHWSLRGDEPEVKHFLIGGPHGTPTVKLCETRAAWLITPGLPLSPSITCPECRARWVALGGRIGREP